MYLSESDFLSVTKNTPLVSVDFLIQNQAGNFLLGFRKNQPAKSYWFVPGGRIRKNETLNQASERVLLNELKISHFANKSFLGVFEHFYSENFFNHTEFGTHYIALCFHFICNDDMKREMKLDDQHSSFKWFSPNLLQADPKVHHYTKNYYNSLVKTKNENYINTPLNQFNNDGNIAEIQPPTSNL